MNNTNTSLSVRENGNYSIVKYNQDNNTNYNGFSNVDVSIEGNNNNGFEKKYFMNIGLLEGNSSFEELVDFTRISYQKSNFQSISNVFRYEGFISYQNKISNNPTNYIGFDENDNAVLVNESNKSGFNEYLDIGGLRNYANGTNSNYNSNELNDYINYLEGKPKKLFKPFCLIDSSGISFIFKRTYDEDEYEIIDDLNGYDFGNDTRMCIFLDESKQKLLFREYMNYEKEMFIEEYGSGPFKLMKNRCNSGGELVVYSIAYKIYLDGMEGAEISFDDERFSFDVLINGNKLYNEARGEIELDFYNKNNNIVFDYEVPVKSIDYKISYPMKFCYTRKVNYGNYYYYSFENSEFVKDVRSGRKYNDLLMIWEDNNSVVNQCIIKYSGNFDYFVTNKSSYRVYYLYSVFCSIEEDKIYLFDGLKRCCGYFDYSFNYYLNDRNYKEVLLTDEFLETYSKPLFINTMKLFIE